MIESASVRRWCTSAIARRIFTVTVRWRGEFDVQTNVWCFEEVVESGVYDVYVDDNQTCEENKYRTCKDGKCAVVAPGASDSGPACRWIGQLRRGHVFGVLSARCVKDNGLL